MATAATPTLSSTDLSLICEALRYYRLQKAQSIQQSIRAAGFLLTGERSESSEMEVLEDLTVHPKVMALMDKLDAASSLEQRLTSRCLPLSA